MDKPSEIKTEQELTINTYFHNDVGFCEIFPSKTIDISEIILISSKIQKFLENNPGESLKFVIIFDLANVKEIVQGIMSFLTNKHRRANIDLRLIATIIHSAPDFYISRSVSILITLLNSRHLIVVNNRDEAKTTLEKLLEQEIKEF